MPARLKVVFWVDVSLLLSFCALQVVRFTGVRVHEWLALSVTGAIIVHLLQSWTWIVSSTRRLLAPESNRTRVNYCLNLCLFACAAVVIFSGILISQDAIPALTKAKPGNRQVDLGWAYIHNRMSGLLLILAALHLAINWDWSVAAARKVLCGPRRPEKE